MKESNSETMISSRLATETENYQINVMRTQMNDTEFSISMPRTFILRDVVGISGEAGELLDLVKKLVFHNHKLDDNMHNKMKKELGDVMWYVAALCNDMGWNLKDVMDMNIEKLQKRYPDGWDEERSKKR